MRRFPVRWRVAGCRSRRGDRAGLRGSTRKGPLAQVKGIRHWSTPTYTRVAIDLGEDVKFEAARVPNPDRIYFDLHGSRLAPELVGKSFSVTDDGFLKKIRAAQFSDNMTRVVLDVNDVSEYSAFLLPNPYRLIIDIHGGSKATTRRETAPVETAKAGNAPVVAVAITAPAVLATSSACRVRLQPLERRGRAFRIRSRRRRTTRPRWRR